MHFNDKTLVQKINDIDNIIETKVREFLQNDGGDLDLVDVQEKNGMIDVYIAWIGACGSCESSGGTQAGIQRILNGQLETDNIRLYTV